MRSATTLADWLWESGLTKASALRVSVVLLGSVACTLAYAVTDQYLHRLLVCMVLGVVQAMVFSIGLFFGGGRLFDIPINRFLLAVFLPVAASPAMCLLIDNTSKDLRIGVPVLVLSKSIEWDYTRTGRKESKVLTLQTSTEIIRKPVPWSFYDSIREGESIQVDVKTGLLGFQRVMEYYRPQKRPTI